MLEESFFYHYVLLQFTIILLAWPKEKDPYPDPEQPEK